MTLATFTDAVLEPGEGSRARTPAARARARAGDRHDRPGAWAVVPVLASAALVGFWLVVGNRFSLWLDEAFSMDLARQPFGRLVSRLAVDEGNMGPYYLALWIWEKLLPGAQFARALSLAGTLVAVRGVWRLGCRWSSPAVAAAAVVAFAANPFVLSWTIQVRGFTWVMAAVVWALVWADRLVRTGSRTAALTLGVLAGVSTATLLTSVFIHAALFVFVAAVRPSQLRRLGWVVFGAAGAFAPFAWAFVANREQISWIPEFGADEFRRRSLELFGGPVVAGFYATTLMLLVLAAIFSPAAGRFLVPGALAVCGVGGVVAASVAVQPMFIARYMAGVLPVAALAAAGGLAALTGARQRWASALMMAACLAATALSVGHVRPAAVEDYRWVAGRVSADGRPGDGVLALPGFSLVAIQQNWAGHPESFPYLAAAGAGALVLSADRRPASPPRVWVVQRGAEETLGDKERALLAALGSAYPVVVTKEVRGPLSLLLLARGPAAAG